MKGPFHTDCLTILIYCHLFTTMLFFSQAMAAEHATTRKQFGHTLSEFGLIKVMFSFILNL